MTSAQIRASERWIKRNKAKQRYYSYKSRTNTFLRKYATKTDIINVIHKAQNRLKEL